MATYEDVIQCARVTGFPAHMVTQIDYFFQRFSNYFTMAQYDDIIREMLVICDQYIVPIAVELGFVAEGKTGGVGELTENQIIEIGAELSATDAVNIIKRYRDLQKNLNFDKGLCLNLSPGSDPSNIMTFVLSIGEAASTDIAVVTFSCPQATVQPKAGMINADANGSYTIPEGFLPELETTDGKPIKFYDNPECTGAPLTAGSVINGGDNNA